MKKIILSMFICMISLITTVSAYPMLQECVNDSHIKYTIIVYSDSDGTVNITKYNTTYPCQYGCNQQIDDCKPNPIEEMIWIIVILVVVIIILSLALRKK